MLYLCQPTGLVNFFRGKVIQATAAAGSNVPQGSSPHPLCSVIPTLGPLHVDFNADEDIVLGYIPLIRLVSESLFSGKKLADKPKPRRVQFLLEVIYGVVKSVFSKF